MPLNEGEDIEALFTRKRSKGGGSRGANVAFARTKRMFLDHWIGAHAAVLQSAEVSHLRMRWSSAAKSIRV